METLIMSKNVDLTNIWRNRLSYLKGKYPDLYELLNISKSAIQRLISQKQTILRSHNLKAIKALYKDDQIKVSANHTESECVFESDEPITDNSYKKPQNIIIWKNEAVLTFQQIDDRFEISEGNTKKNFNSNFTRFREDEHYFKLENGDLKLFKSQVTQSYSPHKFTSSLIIITQQGVARLAKICESDMAWSIYEELEDSYFHKKLQLPPKPDSESKFDLPLDYEQALQHLLVEHRKVKSQQFKLDAQTEEIEYLEHENKDMRPKAEYHDNVLTTTNGIASTSIAAELGMTAILLHKKLDQDLGIIRRIGSDWVLRSKYLDKGYTTTYTFNRPKKDGTIFSKIVTVWTQKGRKFLLGLNYFQPELSFVAKKDVTKNDQD